MPQEDSAMNWNKLPSVMTGGKDFFFTAYRNGNRYSVIWDRTQRAYAVRRNDMLLAFTSTPKDGRKLADRW